MKNCIGFYGGTFNPFHNGHLNLIRYLLENTEINQIILTPSFSPPHKQDEDIVSFADRFKMIKLGIHALLTKNSSAKRLGLSDIEAELPIPNYTYHTLKELQKSRFKSKRLKIIVGNDMFRNIHSWYKWETLSKEFGFIVAKRNELGDYKQKTEVKASLSSHNIYLSNFHWNYSSSHIRQRIKAYSISQNKEDLKEIACYIPEKIFNYIFTRQLYY